MSVVERTFEERLEEAKCENAKCYSFNPLTTTEGDVRGCCKSGKKVKKAFDLVLRELKVVQLDKCVL